jgi:sterol desaturase/sphingolipid hydroxylase (fatty acid hydroxylase superfamily)
LIPHSVVALVYRFIQLAPYFAAGILLEAFLKADRRPERNYLFNGVWTVLFWAFHITVGASVLLLVNGWVVRIPGSGALAVRSTPATIVIFLLSRDLGYYWFHRLQHQVAWLWAQHELHHSDEQMNVSTTWRHHWLEFPLQAFFVFAPLTYLFQFTASGVLAGAVVGEVMAHFVHLNARISFGRWTRLLATPQSHRIHHSIAPQHRDKNFAVIFPFWDVLFGTYYQPLPNEYPETGVEGVQITSMSRAVAWPFLRWAAMLNGHRHIVTTRTYLAGLSRSLATVRVFRP